VLIVTPVIVLWARSPRLNWSRKQVVQIGLILGANVLVGMTTFWGWIPSRFESYPLNVLCIPILVWMALRFTQREAASAVAILAWIAVSGSLSGHGPFGASMQDVSLMPLQMFLGLTAVVTLMFGAVASENRRGREASIRVETIVSSSNDAIVTKTLDGTITSWNPAAARIFGYTDDEVIGRNIRMIIPADHRGQEDQVLARIHRGEVVDHFETVRTRKDGTNIHISLTVSPLKGPDGRIIGASKIARDISDRVRLEAEREGLLARERGARAEAESANRVKDEFLATLSHELRTPLNAVYGWARMLQTGKLDEATEARALDAIVRNADSQVQMIDDLLDVARVVNGKMLVEFHPVDVKAVVEAGLDAVLPTANAKGVGLTRALEAQIGTFNGDPGRLQQIVSNLLMNAVKFTPAGGRVSVELRRLGQRVEIEVSDTGQGIAAHLLPSVFERFRQWDSSSTRAHRGLGLGLALVKHLTELHGGTVTAESDGEGKGAKFIVSLPLCPASQIADGRAEAPGVEIGRPLIGLRVLAVDDDPDALELTSEILRRAGAVVTGCRSAPEALATLEDRWPDVLVSDIEMPGENGYSLIRKFRALERDRGVATPAVAITAYGRMADRPMALSAGFTMHVPKPLDPEEFTTMISGVARVLLPPDRAD
jgi:PAS domain S-box-containing protein